MTDKIEKISEDMHYELREIKKKLGSYEIKINTIENYSKGISDSLRKQIETDKEKIKGFNELIKGIQEISRVLHEIRDLKLKENEVEKE